VLHPLSFPCLFKSENGLILLNTLILTHKSFVSSEQILIHPEDPYQEQTTIDSNG